MQEHERAVFQQGSVTWKKSKDSISLDTKSLLQHQPELIQQYPLQKAGSRRSTFIKISSKLRANHSARSNLKSRAALHGIFYADFNLSKQCNTSKHINDRGIST